MPLAGSPIATARASRRRGAYSAAAQSRARSAVKSAVSGTGPKSALSKKGKYRRALKNRPASAMVV